MIDNRLRDNNGDNVTSYHQRHFSRFTGFPDYHNTNIDKVCQFLDEPTFQSFLDYQEQDRAYDINYAHGLELDDEFGDPFGIDRNGMDDDAYRFILKCHILAIKCNGTLPELIQFVSAVLGCSEDDVTLGMARHYTKTGKLVGEPDTILINNINVANLSNSDVIPLLASQIQLAVAADKRVLDVDFDTNISTKAYIGVEPVFGAGINIKFPKDIESGMEINMNAPKTGVTALGYTGINLNVPETIEVDSAIKLNNHIGVSAIGAAELKIGEPQQVSNAIVSDQEVNVGVTLQMSASISI